jgi:Domain of unknown function (DUF4189)
MKKYVALFLMFIAASVAMAATTAKTASGHVSVYISDNRAVGLSISPNDPEEADQIALDKCVEFAVDDDKYSCVKAIEGVAKCVAVARSEQGAWGAAMDETIKKASDMAIKTCKKYTKEKCVVDKAAKLCL